MVASFAFRSMLYMQIRSILDLEVQAYSQRLNESRDIIFRIYKYLITEQDHVFKAMTSNNHEI